MPKTTPLFRDDAYLSTCEAEIIAIDTKGGIVLSQTCFYANSGGQPGDIGFLERQDGSKIQIIDTIHGKTKNDILHLAEDHASQLDIGEKMVAHIDWPRRYKLMRMHSACHLLSVICPYPVTGASVSEDNSRIDFDMGGIVADKADITEKLMALVNENHPIYTTWIDESELEQNPDLVKSKNVRPPRGIGKIRLVCIGHEAFIDSQPCGGTHVAETQEIGAIHIGKIEKKGKENRRFRIRFGELPQ